MAAKATSIKGVFDPLLYFALGGPDAKATSIKGAFDPLLYFALL